MGATPEAAPGTARRTATEPAQEDDATLVARARRGDTAAFDALYRRHHEPAWRLALVVTATRSDAEDAVAEAFARVLAALPRTDVAAFRPYLLRCVRNAATDAHRRTARVDLRDEIDLTTGPDPERVTAPGAEELAVADTEAALALAALQALPERWRTVLWLTEVEEMGPADAGQILGLSANATAGLSFRAREGLRRAYLAAHLQPGASAACAAITEQLPAYARGLLATRARDRVDAHLAGCDDCGQRLEELDEVNRRLAGLLLPAPVLLQPLARMRWQEVLHHGAGGGPLGVWADKLARSGPVRSAVGVAAAILLLGGALVVLAPDRDAAPAEAPPGAGAEDSGPAAGTDGTAGDGSTGDRDGPALPDATTAVEGTTIERTTPGPGPDPGPLPIGRPAVPPAAPDGDRDPTGPGGALPGPGSDTPAGGTPAVDHPANGGGGDGPGNGGGGQPPGGPQDPQTVAGVGLELGQGPVGVVVGVALTDQGPEVDLTAGEEQIVGGAPPSEGTCLTLEHPGGTHQVLCPTTSARTARLPVGP